MTGGPLTIELAPTTCVPQARRGLEPLTAEDQVPVHRPHLGREVQEAARSALEVGWLGMGGLSRQFELALEERLE